jgi:signal transduction histidine kinase
MLDDLGLLPALTWHFEKYTSQTGVQVNFKQSGLPAVLPSELSITIYRIIQEALTNVARYAKTKRVSVNLLFKKGVMSIRVADRGRGFSLPEVDTRATAGLSGMRERVLLLGGRMVLESAPQKGTRILVELPITVEKGLLQ